MWEKINGNCFFFLCGPEQNDLRSHNGPRTNGWASLGYVTTRSLQSEQLVLIWLVVISGPSWAYVDPGLQTFLCPLDSFDLWLNSPLPVFGWYLVIRITGPDSGMILASDSVLLLWYCWGRRGRRRGKGSVTRRNNGPISGLQAWVLSRSELIKSIHTPLMSEMWWPCPHPSSSPGRRVAQGLF